MAPGHQSKLFKLKKQSLKGRNKCEMKETRLPSCESLRTIRNYRHDRCPYSKRKYLSIACENLVDLWPNLVPSKLSNYKKLHDIFLQKSNCFSIMLRIPTNFLLRIHEKLKLHFFPNFATTEVNNNCHAIENYLH